MLLAWVLFGALIGVAAANSRGFSVAGGIVAGLLLGPLAFLMFFASGGRKRCIQCAEWVQRQAKICPHCKSAVPPDEPLSGKWRAAIALGIVAVIAYGATRRLPPPPAHAPSSVLHPVAALPAAVAKPVHEPEAPAAQPPKPRGMVWMYASEGDPMGGQIRSATVHSNNELNLDFPYEGPQHAHLSLRSHPRYGKDVILSIERGQFMCGVSDCQVLVRFDEGTPVKFDAAEPNDNDSTVLFIRNYARFLANLRKAKVVRIQATLFQQGAPVLEFNVGALDEARLHGDK
jgi:hypothetical protein